MSIKLLAFAASLLGASAALAQPAQLEVNDAWARATPGKADNGRRLAELALAAIRTWNLPGPQHLRYRAWSNLPGGLPYATGS